MGAIQFNSIDCDTYFDTDGTFFGVLWGLLGVRGRDTGVVLGAMPYFFGVASRLGDGCCFAAGVGHILKMEF